MKWRTPQGYFQLSEDGRYSVAAAKVQGEWTFQPWRSPRHEQGRLMLGNAKRTSVEARTVCEVDDDGPGGA